MIGTPPVPKVKAPKPKPQLSEAKLIAKQKAAEKKALKAGFTPEYISAQEKSLYAEIYEAVYKDHPEAGASFAGEMKVKQWAKLYAGYQRNRLLTGTEDKGFKAFRNYWLLNSQRQSKSGGFFGGAGGGYTIAALTAVAGPGALFAGLATKKGQKAFGSAVEKVKGAGTAVGGVVKKVAPVAAGVAGNFFPGLDNLLNPLLAGLAQPDEAPVINVSGPSSPGQASSAPSGFPILPLVIVGGLALLYFTRR